jgi:Helix-turn-helix domain
MPISPPPGYYRALQVAEMLHCSEWWIKEQARKGRIPYSWIGGSYLFTDEDVAEIVRRFRRTADAPEPAEPPPVKSRPTKPECKEPTLLRARAPRRSRRPKSPA